MKLLIATILLMFWIFTSSIFIIYAINECSVVAWFVSIFAILSSGFMIATTFFATIDGETVGSI